MQITEYFDGSPYKSRSHALKIQFDTYVDLQIYEKHLHLV
jgi:hypothetical protein